MATIVNDRDLILRSTSPRVIITSVAIAGTAAVFIKTKNNGPINPTDIVLTAITTIFTSPTFAWSYAVDTAPTTWISAGSGATQTVVGTAAVAAIASGASVTYKVEATQAGFLDAENTFQINLVREVDDTYRVHIARTSSIVNADSSGVPLNYNDTDNIIKVLKGNSEMNYGTSGADTFSVGTPILSPTAVVTLSTGVGSGTTVTYANITNMVSGTDYAYATFPVTIRDSGGGTVAGTYTGMQTFTKVRAGTTGSTYSLSIVDPIKIIPTNADGSGGTYTGATTLVKVMNGSTDDTSAWSFDISPESGLTATINGSAGPVTGTSTVTVAVSNSTVTSARVLITATKASAPTLTGYFTITKSLAGNNGWQHYIEPDTIYLPIDSSGNVTDYTNAVADYYAITGSTNDTSNWSLSKVDSGVTSTLSSAGHIAVTSLIAAGTLTNPTATNFTTISGWTNNGYPIHGNGTFIVPMASGTAGSVRRSTDLITWTTVSLPTSPYVVAYPRQGVYGNSTFVLLRNANTSTGAYSTDYGVSWTAMSLPSTAIWTACEWCGSQFIAVQYSGTAAAKSTNGITWTSHTVPASNPSGIAEISYGNGITIYYADSTFLYRSTNDGVSWGSNTISNLGLAVGENISRIVYFKGKWIASIQNASFMLISDDAITWTKVSTTNYGTSRGYTITTSRIFMQCSAGTMYSIDGISWYLAASTPTSPSFGFLGSPLNTDYVPFIDNSSYKKLGFSTGNGESGTVVVTATKTGETTVSRTLYVRKGEYDPSVYTAQASPSWFTFPATSDGVVTSYDGAILTAVVYKNGVVDTANWTFSTSVSDASITSTGSGGTYTITGMGTSINTGIFTITATKVGQPIRTIPVTLTKNKLGGPSGPMLGVAYSAFTTSSGLVGLRFKSDGSFQIKYGTGGTYTEAGFWYTPRTTSIGTSYWLRMTTSGDALTSGTTGSWLQLNTDRDFTLERLTSGTSTTNLTVDIGNTSSGGAVTRGSGSLIVEVP